MKMASARFYKTNKCVLSGYKMIINNKTKQQWLIKKNVSTEFETFSIVKAIQCLFYSEFIPFTMEMHPVVMHAYRFSCSD